MGNVAHLVTVAETDDRREVVLHDPEMIAMVVDVGRQQGRIASADDPLFAEPRRAPVHLQRKLIGLDDAWRLAEAFA
jgi:hypothetical protein